MKWQISILAVLTAVVFVAAAEDPKPGPRSPKVRFDIGKYKLQLAKAERDYKAAIENARKELIAKLKVHKSAALRSENLREANAIHAEIKKLEETKAEPNKPEKNLVKDKVLAELQRYTWKGSPTTKQVVTFGSDGLVRWSDRKETRPYAVTDAGLVLFSSFAIKVIPGQKTATGTSFIPVRGVWKVRPQKLYRGPLAEAAKD